VLLVSFEPETAVFEVPRTEGAVEFSNSGRERLKFIACPCNCHLVFLSSLNSWHHFLMDTGVPHNCCRMQITCYDYSLQTRVLTC